jgi:hypothetical protein
MRSAGGRVHILPKFTRKMILDDFDKLNISLYSRIPSPTREIIIREFWGCDTLVKTSRSLNLLNEYYFSYQEKQCRLAIYNHRRCGITATYRDITNIVCELREKNLDRESLKEKLQNKLGISESEIESSELSCVDSDNFSEELINLAICLWLMVPVGVFRLVALHGTYLD